MANIDRMPCRRQDNWRLHSARVLHWIHLQGSSIPSQNLLRSDLSNQNNPQEDDWHHHPRCFNIWFEGSRQQASPRLDRQGHREVVPRSLPIARCLHPQGECLLLQFPCSTLILPACRWKCWRSLVSICRSCWNSTETEESRPSQQQLLLPPQKASQSSAQKDTNHQFKPPSKFHYYHLWVRWDPCWFAVIWKHDLNTENYKRSDRGRLQALRWNSLKCDSAASSWKSFSVLELGQCVSILANFCF